MAPKPQCGAPCLPKLLAIHCMARRQRMCTSLCCCPDGTVGPPILISVLQMQTMSQKMSCSQLDALCTMCGGNLSHVNTMTQQPSCGARQNVFQVSCDGRVLSPCKHTVRKHRLAFYHNAVVVLRTSHVHAETKQAAPPPLAINQSLLTTCVRRIQRSQWRWWSHRPCHKSDSVRRSQRFQRPCWCCNNMLAWGSYLLLPSCGCWR